MPEWLVFGCVAVNFAVWFCVKDLQWMLHIGSVALSVLGKSFEPPVWNLLVPVGISYYTLQAFGYLFDVHSGKIAPEKNFFKYLLFFINSKCSILCNIVCNAAMTLAERSAVQIQPLDDRALILHGRTSFSRSPALPNQRGIRRYSCP